MNIKGNFEIRLSLDSIQEYQEMLQEYAKELSVAIIESVEEVSNLGLEDNYSSAVVIPTQATNGIITSGIKTTEEKHTYQEFGTGVEGSKNPHISDWLSKSGWKYDVNKHGEKGWVYPTEEGLKWTKGVNAQKKFYNATVKMEEKFPEIVKENIKKIQK